MFDRNIERMFEQMKNEMFSEKRMNIVRGDVDGYRAEVVDGDVTEYVYEDGDWEEVGLDAGQPFQIGETDSGFELTVETAEFDQLRGFAPSDVSASFNNGILSVEMEAATDADESDE